MPNGLVLLVKPSGFSDLVSVEVILKISISDAVLQNASEPAEQIGIRSLLQELLVRGSESKSRQLDEWGGAVGADAALDYVKFDALVVSDGFETAMQALSDSIRHPDFDAAAVERVREEKLRYLEALREDHFHRTYLLFRQKLYGDHPYALSSDGYERTMGAISREQLLDFYSRWYLPNNTLISVCGNVTPERARKVVERTFGDWKAQPLPERKRLVPERLSHSGVAVEEGMTTIAHVLIGFPGPPAANKEEFAAFQVLNSILSRGMSGRLIESLRNELGLAYDISCFHSALEQASHLVIHVQCELSQIDAVKKAVVEQINRLMQEEVGEEELEIAKRYLLGQYLVSLQRGRQQAHNLAWYEILGLGAGFQTEYPALIKTVTAPDLQRISQKYLQKMVISLRLPEETPI